MWFRGLVKHRNALQKVCSRAYVSPNVSKERLLSEYHRAYAYITNAKMPKDVNKIGVFANDELDLGEVNVYGFDYDYTLAAYRKTTVEKLIHSLAKKALVTELKYPEEILKFEYDPNLTIRGLHYDVEKGLLIKVNSVLQIQSDAVFRGRRQLKEEEVSKIYPSRRLTLDVLEPKGGPSPLVHLVDNFAKPVMCLLADVIQWFVDNGIDYEPESIYMDVRECIDKAHPLFHLAAASDPKVILEQDPHMRPMLERLKANGKTTFLMTNSPFEIVDAGMRYLIGDDWRKLFDIVIVSAKKPSFFSARNRHFRVYAPRTQRLKWQRVINLERGKIYSGGNYDSLKKMTGWQPGQVLYFGDHPYADLADLNLLHGWRTCAIIEELEEEIEKNNDPDMKMKVSWSNVLQELLKTYQDYPKDDQECKKILDDWKEELFNLRLEMKVTFNENFGSVFRSKKNPTFFQGGFFESLTCIPQG